MSKSMLVIDTPNSCSVCEFKGYKSENAQYTCCNRLDYCIHDNMLEKGKFKNCPLQDTTELLKTINHLMYYGSEKIDKTIMNMADANHIKKGLNVIKKALGGM